MKRLLAIVGCLVLLTVSAGCTSMTGMDFGGGEKEKRTYSSTGIPMQTPHSHSTLTSISRCTKSISDSSMYTLTTHLVRSDLSI
ncbi:hypothetical protein ACFQL7_14030 [Halocatena marina]|uniref:Uncharacterized protein n=1 Tax=Halocatena marina TaxID=2934937 RepID=A0ABD5YTK7_9EURY